MGSVLQSIESRFGGDDTCGTSVDKLNPKDSSDPLSQADEIRVVSSPPNSTDYYVAQFPELDLQIIIVHNYEALHQVRRDNPNECIWTDREFVAFGRSLFEDGGPPFRFRQDVDPVDAAELLLATSLIKKEFKGMCGVKKKAG